jgi:sporulation protein YlmC with PRC-barrel domain
MSKKANHTNATLHKKAVVSLADGERIGEVDDLLIDPVTLRFAALVIKGDNGQSLLPREHIKVVGEDAITIESVSATQSGPNSLPGLQSFSELSGNKVVDSQGTLIGHLHDFEIDSKTGDIASLDVHSGGVLGLGAHSHHVPASAICSIGPELITVTASNKK